MGLVLQIKWKGPKLTLSSLRRNAIAKNFTREAQPQPDDVVFWDEEFHTLCTLSAYKDNAFHPWEIAFSIFNISISLEESIEIVHKSIVLVPSSPVVQPGETTLVEKDELSTCNRRHRRSEASLARFLPLPKRVHQIARNAEPCIYH
ncbi:hypothetical protein VIGAN_04100100 [Vigna angularis var. angularis]|uniref:C2 NT-type domain-containing protein n=1 Tax=Vigna angularis var. angularis TaxID=157739 RepID=A0A0S3RT78_PHAAN|nr:hypothetical protein VIGAN_04100100 [Vigna angularis var. angularis]